MRFCLYDPQAWTSAFVYSQVTSNWINLVVDNYVPWIKHKKKKKTNYVRALEGKPKQRDPGGNLMLGEGNCVVWVSFSYSFETIGGPQSASCSAVTTQWKPPDVLVWGMSWEFAATRGAGKWEGKAESQIFRVQPYSLLLWLMDDSGTTGHSEYLLGKCATPK